MCNGKNCVMHTVSNLESAASMVLKSPELVGDMVGAAFEDFVAAQKIAATVNPDSKIRTFYTKDGAILLPAELNLLIECFSGRLREHFNFSTGGDEDYMKNLVDSVRRAVFALPTLSNIKVALDEVLNEDVDTRRHLIGFFVPHVNGGKWQDELPKRRFEKILKDLEKKLFQIFLMEGERELRRRCLAAATFNTVIIGFPDRHSLSKENKAWVKDFALHRTSEVMNKIRERFDFYYAATNDVPAGNQSPEAV